MGSNPSLDPPIPFVDLGAQHAEVADEVEVGWKAVLAATAFVGGPAVAAFETAYASFAGVRHCVGVANGTDALELALRAIGAGPGAGPPLAADGRDEVVLPANTFIATAEAVVRAGARPVLVDVDPEHLLIDVDRVAGALNPRTRAVMPVHLYGQMAPVQALAGVLDGSGVVMIEDAAQAHGARQEGTRSGVTGLAAGTSFYPGKNLGAYGDGGAVLTDDDDVADHVRLLREHGSRVKYEHVAIGVNSRLDTLQAVVLSAKLDRLAQWNVRRRAAAERYRSLLQDVDDVVVPTTCPGNEHVWHLFVIRVPRRDEVLEALGAAGIGAGIHYPVPLHLTSAFRGLDLGPGSFPVAEAAAREILSLPLFPQITPEQQARVVEVLAKALA